MKYILVTGNDLWKFQIEVERRLVQGRELRGGVSVATATHNGTLMIIYSQAMTKVHL